VKLEDCQPGMAVRMPYRDQRVTCNDFSRGTITAVGHCYVLVMWRGEEWCHAPSALESIPSDDRPKQAHADRDDP